GDGTFPPARLFALVCVLWLAGWNWRVLLRCPGGEDVLCWPCLDSCGHHAPGESAPRTAVLPGELHSLLGAGGPRRTVSGPACGEPGPMSDRRVLCGGVWRRTPAALCGR